MVEVTRGIFEASKEIYSNNRGSILRTIVYTIGHFAIAITVLMLIADVAFMIALTDAIVEPVANSVWYFYLYNLIIVMSYIFQKHITTNF